jgi:prepilin-type N-terminal cleavage/methylation domain-containing protein
MHNVKFSKLGFTLIELLVVLVILLVVASLIFPVFTRAKYAARETVCIQHVRQVLMGLEMYVADFGSEPVAQPAFPILEPFIGAKLECPVAESKPTALRYPLSDYLLTAIPPPLGPSPPAGLPEHHRAWRECRDMRGPEFPVVLDVNHISVVEEVERGIAFVILGRAGGSAEKVVDRTKEFYTGVPSPCHRDLLYLNL